MRPPWLQTDRVAETIAQTEEAIELMQDTIERGRLLFARSAEVTGRARLALVMKP